MPELRMAKVMRCFSSKSVIASSLTDGYRSRDEEGSEHEAQQQRGHRPMEKEEIAHIPALACCRNRRNASRRRSIGAAATLSSLIREKARRLREQWRREGAA